MRFRSWSFCCHSCRGIMRLRIPSASLPVCIPNLSSISCERISSRSQMEGFHPGKAADMVVADRLALESKVAAIRAAGPAKLQVIADFDATLTKYWVDGRRGHSSHGLLQQDNPEFDAKRQALYEYYHPLEFSPTIPIEEKTKLMEEWWGKSHALLIEGGLSYDAIKKSVANSAVAFREGVAELLEFLEVLRQKLHKSFKNVKIISNRMVFNDGKLVAFKGKTIHVLNKNEHALDVAAPLHDKLGDVDGTIDDTDSVKKRTNVLLLGDHIGDLGMSDGLNYDTRVSVGFLNDNIEKSLESYGKAFDIVYLNDSPMYGVVKLVNELCSNGEN
uniref:5'-nucleotidase n=1 Tax=Kalanchoe fedtschenkoi TaxID=63787 RepID=A0A7N0TMH8_KALFE